MRVNHALTYSDVFPGIKMPLLKDLLADVSTGLVIECFFFFNSILHINAFDESNQRKCLKEVLVVSLKNYERAYCSPVQAKNGVTEGS